MINYNIQLIITHTHTHTHTHTYIYIYLYYISIEPRLNWLKQYTFESIPCLVRCFVWFLEHWLNHRLPRILVTRGKRLYHHLQKRVMWEITCQEGQGKISYKEGPKEIFCEDRQGEISYEKDQKS